MLNFSRSEKLKIINLGTQKNILSVKEGQTFDKGIFREVQTKNILKNIYGYWVINY